MFKELYYKSLKLAAHKSSKYFLAFISFIESFIFPIPPDVLIIPMTIADRKKWLKHLKSPTFFGGRFSRPGSTDRKKSRISLDFNIAFLAPILPIDRVLKIERMEMVDEYRI